MKRLSGEGFHIIWEIIVKGLRYRIDDFQLWWRDIWRDAPTTDWRAKVESYKNGEYPYPEKSGEDVSIRVKGEALYLCNGCNEPCIGMEDQPIQCQKCGSTSLTLQHRV
jgi:DNA-directed RNA polymerase subunit RPC12/RpoP